MPTNFKRTFGNATSPLALSYLDDNFSQLEAAGTSTVSLSGAQLIGYIQSGTGATSLAVQAVLRALGKTPQQFGAAADGTTDDTSAFQKAIDAAGAGYIYLPAGTYKITSTLTFPTSGFHMVGQGMNASIIKFAPTANDVCLAVANGASQVTRWSMRDFSIKSDDSTYTKTALDITDAGVYELSNIEIGGSVTVSGTNYWSGSNSIGLRTRGREFGVFKNLYIVADRPILVSQNPNDSAKALDHHDFDDLYLIANANPCIEVEDGCRLVNVSFGGKQAWVRGTYGFDWVDTTAISEVSSNLTFSGIRTEQGTDTSSYSIRISLSGTGSSFLQDVSIKCSTFEAGRHQFYFRNVRRVSLEETTYAGTSGDTAIDMTGIANSVLTLNNVVMGASTTATLTSLVRIMESRPSTTTYPMGEYAVYAASSRDGLRLSQLASASLHVAAVSNQDGLFLLEDCGSGQKNLVVYATSIRQKARLGSGLVELFDDFLGDVLADEWNGRVGSNGSCVTPTITAAVGGAVRLTTGADAGGTMALNGSQLESSLNWQANSVGLMCEFRIKLSAITNVAVFIGLTDQVSALEIPIESAASADTLTSNAADAVGVMFDTSMATDNWWLVGVSNTTPATAQDSAVAPSAGTYETWRITVSTGGTATFYRNGTAIGTAMTGSTRGTVPLTPVVAALSRGAASRNIDLDHILVEQNRA